MPVQLKAIEGGKQTASDGGEDLKPYFDKRKGGLYYIERKQNQDTGAVDERETWVSDEMETVGIGSDGKDGYIVIRMKQEGTGTLLYEAMPRRELGSPQGWGRLRSRVNITARRAHLDLLTNHLQLHGDREQWTITHTAGWHEGAYVMPDGHIIGKPERPVAFCGGTSAVTGYVVAERRQNGAVMASLMRGNKSMVLGALVPFAAPLNSLAGGSCFGIHLFAQSSAGKTTTVEAASSIYGVPDELKLTWDATKYGLTIEAASRNDGFMPIDEIGQGNNAKDVAGSAYSLFNGTGRIQGHKDGGNRAVLRWAIVALSTGEEDFETYLLRNGLTPKAGQLVRLVSVPFSTRQSFTIWTMAISIPAPSSGLHRNTVAQWAGSGLQCWPQTVNQPARRSANGKTPGRQTCQRIYPHRQSAWQFALPCSMQQQNFPCPLPDGAWKKPERISEAALMSGLITTAPGTGRNIRLSAEPETLSSAMRSTVSNLIRSVSAMATWIT